MTQPRSNGDTAAPEPAERELSGHIFAVSAGLVGVCLTVIGLFRLFGGPQELRSLADNLLAVDALAFLLSCFLAYLALRSRAPARRHRLERLADGIFLLGLTAMVLIGGLIAYELI
ncbi:MAG TPA: hypothetical protein VFU46_00675 [Gemmatimonadales bacterium]|nr:hypothetical protein [Gemmatimonadales bacterium]